jgi:hypothetical protein
MRHIAGNGAARSVKRTVIPRFCYSDYRFLDQVRNANLIYRPNSRLGKRSGEALLRRLVDFPGRCGANNFICQFADGESEGRDTGEDIRRDHCFHDRHARGRRQHN